MENSNADAQRIGWLESQGFRVIRYWNDQVLKETDAVLEEILRVLNGDK